MADDEPLRHAFDTSRIAGQRFHRVWHGRLLNPLNCTTARQQRASIRNSAHAPSAHIKIVECCGCSVPTKRNLLDKASVAQSLDGNRLTGSLLVPGPQDYIRPTILSQARAMSALRHWRTLRCVRSMPSLVNRLFHAFWWNERDLLERLKFPAGVCPRSPAPPANRGTRPVSAGSRSLWDKRSNRISTTAPRSETVSQAAHR